MSGQYTLFDTPPAVQLPRPKITVRRERKGATTDGESIGTTAYGHRAEGRALAEKGMQRALDRAGSAWVESIVAEARAWCAKRGGHRITLEQFRQDARSSPVSHKAWGSLPRILCKAGLLAPVTHADGSAVFTPAGSLKTHAHPVRVWLVL